jgi:molecular chaperone GrpE
VTAGNGKGDDRDDEPGSADGEPRGVTGVDVQPMPALDREQVEALRKERDELNDQLLRKRAEFENYRKRVERDREQSATEAAASVLKAVIPTIDNLDRALEATGAESTLRQGVELTRRELLGLLERQGVTIEDPVGQPFDPQRHQALSH